MHRLLAAALVLGSSSVGLAVEKIEPVPVEGKIDWVYSYAAGKQKAKDTGQPMFVVFRCER